MALPSRSTWPTPSSRPCRLDELIQLTWSDCQRVGEEIVALRIKGKGSVFQDVPVTGRLSAALLEWKALQEKFKGRRILAPGGIAFAGSPFIFAEYLGGSTGRSIYGCAPRAEPSGVGRLPRMPAPQRGNNSGQPRGKGFAGNAGAAPPQEYPQHGPLYPLRL